jgi:hypothetical protein
MTESFKAVSSGFKLVYVGFLLQVLAVVIYVVFEVGIRGGMIGIRGWQMLFNVLYLCGGLAVLGQIIGLIGRFRCMAIPREVGTKQTIGFSVALSLISLALLILAYVNLYVELFLSLDVVLMLEPVANIVSLIAIILFLLYTKSVAEFIRRDNLAASAQSVLMIVVLLAILLIVTQVAVRMGVGAVVAGNGANAIGAGGMYIVLGLASLVVLMIFAIRYSNLLLVMGKATMNYSKKSTSEFDDEDEDEDEEEDRPRRRRAAKDDDDEWES